MKFEGLDKKKVEKALSMAFDAAKEQILTDCNFFCREDQGTLIDSARAEVKGSKLEISWNTPYAKRVYYTGTPAKNRNKNASLRWAEKAKNRFGKDWQKIVAQKMRENL